MHSALAEKQCEVEAAASAQTSSAYPELTFAMNLVDNATKNLLQSMAGVLQVAPSPPASPEENILDNPIADWGVFAATENTYLNRSQEEEGVALLAKSVLDRFEDLSLDGSGDERSDMGDTPLYEPDSESAQQSKPILHWLIVYHHSPDLQPLMPLITPMESEHALMIPPIQIPSGFHGETKL